MKQIITLSFLLLIGQQTLKSQTEVSFNSKDGLEVYAWLYHVNESLPLIILCHQARSNHYEYEDIAPILNKMGFNCLSIDQRSGGKFPWGENKTNIEAKKKAYPVSFMASKEDILAAINYAKGKYPSCILMGSSYSASLALNIAAENQAVTAVIAFSPDEYFGNELNIGQSINTMKKPAFITCSKSEIENTKKIADQLAGVHFFTPTTDGNHGAKALWSEFADSKAYWDDLTLFLKQFSNR